MADDTEQKILHTTAIYNLEEQTDVANDNEFIMATPDKQTVKVKFSAIAQAITNTSMSNTTQQTTNNEIEQTSGIDVYTTDTYMKNYTPDAAGVFKIKENGRYNLHCACDFGKATTNCQNVLQIKIKTASDWCTLCEKRTNLQNAELDCHIYGGTNVEIKTEATTNGKAVDANHKPTFTITAIKQGENFSNSQETLICAVPAGSYESQPVTIPVTANQPYGIISVKAMCSSNTASEQKYDYSMNVHVQYSVNGTTWYNLQTNAISKANTAQEYASRQYLVKSGWKIRICFGAKASDYSKVSGYPSNTFLITYKSMEDTNPSLKNITLENINWSNGTQLNFQINSYNANKKTTWSGNPASNAANNMIGIAYLGVPVGANGDLPQYTGFTMFKNNVLSSVQYSPTSQNHIYMPSFRNNPLTGTYQMYTTDNYETLRVATDSNEVTAYEKAGYASNLTSVGRFGNKITHIDNECFKGTGIQSVTFNNKISAFGLYKTFFQCYKLKNIEFANGVISSIGGTGGNNISATFTDCSSLTAVNLEALSCCQPDLKLGDFMFRNCTALSTLDLRCFSSLNFKNDTTHEPFKGCKNLRKIYFDYQHFMNFSIDKTSHTHMLAGVTASNAIKMSIYLTDVPDTVTATEFENSTKPKFQFLTEFYKKQNITIIGVKPNGSTLTSYHLKGS